MRCRVCGLTGCDYFHLAGHILSDERHRGRGMQAGAGGRPVVFPTFRETAVMVGTAIERDITTFKNGRLVVPE